MLRYLFLFLFLIPWVVTCAIAQDKVNFQSEADNIITLRVTAYGKKAENAIVNAERAAIQAILFRGIPGSKIVSNPLVGTDEIEIQKEHSDYFSSFFQNGRYRSFVLSNVPVSDFGKDITKKKCITVDVKINIQGLRIDLEKQGVIRKFGF